ncbi:MAG: translation elongation factor Ts, partial [bacterium]|nr:translation elongation factor Ts [bacterium]
VEPLPADPAGLPADVEELRATTVGKLGENMVIRRFARFDLASPGKLQLYIHPGNKLAVLVTLLSGKAETVATHEFQELCTDIGMQIAAAAPTTVDRTELTKDVLDRELEIAKEQARQTGKPEAVIEKIAIGKMEKIYSELCLLEQPFVKDPKFTVTTHLEEVAKKLGDTISIREFARFKIGE